MSIIITEKETKKCKPRRLLNVCARFFRVGWRPQPSPRRIFMLTTLNNLWKNESGVTAIEYGLIAALIAVAVVVILGTVGTELSSTFNKVATNLYSFAPNRHCVLPPRCRQPTSRVFFAIW